MSRSSIRSRSPSSPPKRAGVRSPNEKSKNSPTNSGIVVEETVDAKLEKLKNALLTDPFLKPTYVEVKDESCWYAWRTEIGPRKQMAKLTKLNERQGKWESRIFLRKDEKPDGNWQKSTMIPLQNSSS